MMTQGQQGKSIIEYIVVLVAVMGFLYVMQSYILGAFNGRWKTSGESFTTGRQYDPHFTATCAFVQVAPDYGVWHDTNCYQVAVAPCHPSDKTCEVQAMESCRTNFCCEQNRLPAGQTNCS